MKKYTLNYLSKTNQLSNDNSNYVECEICEGRGSEIHHILNKNRLLDLSIINEKDCIENTMAICRGCHKEYGDINIYIPYLFDIHKLRMKNYGVEINEAFIDRIQKHYEDIN